MKNGFYWILFFIVCFALGLIHGLRPRGTALTALIPPQSISVLVTDEALFNAEIRKELESKLSVNFSVTVTRDWDSFIVKLIESPSVDLILTPSFWVQSLTQQNLLSNISEIPQNNFSQRISPDFLKNSQAGFFLFPLYWTRTSIVTPQGKSFKEFLADKSLSSLHLLADEDVILAHLVNWEKQGILSTVTQKKLFALPLEQLTHQDNKTGALETASAFITGPTDDSAYLSALLVWGAAIPKNSAKKETALKVLKALSEKELQESYILKSPFNSCLQTLSDNKIPLNRRSEWVRDLKFNETILIENKDIDALEKVREIYNINIL